MNLCRYLSYQRITPALRPGLRSVNSDQYSLASMIIRHAPSLSLLGVRIARLRRSESVNRSRSAFRRGVEGVVPCRRRCERIALGRRGQPLTKPPQPICGELQSAALGDPNQPHRQ